MVKLLNRSIQEFCSYISGQDISFACFGVGSQSRRFFENYPDMGARLSFFVDNDPKKQGSSLRIAGKEKPVFLFAKLAENARGNKRPVLLVTSLYAVEILEQLDQCADLDGMETYLLVLMDKARKQDFSFTKGPALIPKKIHYCWFGMGTLPDAFQRYIDGWKRLCPEYEILRHDESNYDVAKNAYMREAYEMQKWGFVSDCARLDIVYHEGGIYLDTDVELVKKPDALLGDRFFCAFQSMGEINTGLGFGSVKKHPFLKELMDAYNGKRFVKEDGALDLTTCTYYQEPVFKRRGFALNGSYQNIGGAVVYPEEVLSPLHLWSGELALTDKTIAIHYYTSTWASEHLRRAVRELRKRYKELETRCRNTATEMGL